MQSALELLGLGSSCSILLVLDGADERNTMVIYSPTSHKRVDELPLFGESETVSGKVVISIKKGKSLQHMGIRIEFIGAIEIESSQEFTSLVRELEDPGILVGTRQYPFAFTNVEKTYDTYNGVNVGVPYEEEGEED
jgi:vacuolar protein sorting-associated protein 26